MTSKRTGRGTVLFGLLVLLAGIGGAVVLYLLSQQRDDDAIRDLARAPVGCTTRMSFNDTGTFYVYIEHLGRLEELDGDCDTSTDEYSRDPDDEPVVEITRAGRRRNADRAGPGRRRVHLLPRRFVRGDREAPVRDRDRPATTS